MIPHFLGNNFPKLKFVTILYCKISSRLRSFGFCSKAPKPLFEIFPVEEKVAKSAKFPSKLATAAQPPLFSNSDIRSSLNQTSPLESWVSLLLIPTINVRTKPKFGFPLIPSFNGFIFPAKLGSKSLSFLKKISPGA